MTQCAMVMTPWTGVKSRPNPGDIFIASNLGKFIPNFSTIQTFILVDGTKDLSIYAGIKLSY